MKLSMSALRGVTLCEAVKSVKQGSSVCHKDWECKLDSDWVTRGGVKGVGDAQLRELRLADDGLDDFCCTLDLQIFQIYLHILFWLI